MLNKIVIRCVFVFIMVHYGFAAYAADDVRPDSVMRLQADGFLRSMPTGLQQLQSSAIVKAISGDTGDLERVRESRNTVQQISENVTARMLSTDYRLYEHKDRVDRLQPLLIYFHGGGWTFGSINSCARFCNAMAATGEVKVLAVDYRLAPEHPFPAGLDDCSAALDYAIDNASSLNIDPERITVGGDSSGGNLAIALALSACRPGVPESLLLFYPVTKAFADGSASWLTYGSGYGLDAEIMEVFNSAYTIGSDQRDCRISVGLCDSQTLSELPRTLLVAAGRDILSDQGKEFAQKSCGRVKRVEFPEAVHLFITVAGQDCAFDKAVALSLSFITDVCSGID